MAAMKESTYWLLCALAAGEAHGYGLARRVAELTDAQVALGPGTLYAALERLTADGLVEPAGSEVVDGRNRRYYRLTEPGRRAVSDETDRRTASVRRARLALGLA